MIIIMNDTDRTILDLQDTFQPNTYTASMTNLSIEIYDLFCESDIELKNDMSTGYEDITNLSINIIDEDGDTWTATMGLEGDHMDNNCIVESIACGEVYFTMD